MLSRRVPDDTQGFGLVVGVCHVLPLSSDGDFSLYVSRRQVLLPRTGQVPIASLKVLVRGGHYYPFFCIFIEVRLISLSLSGRSHWTRECIKFSNKQAKLQWRTYLGLLCKVAD